MSTDQALWFAPDVFRRKSYVVTGGGHGIGAGIVRTLLAHEASVTTIELNHDRCRSLADQFKEQSARLEVIEGNAGDSAVMRRAIDQSLARFGGLHGWVNNAYFSKRRLMVDQPEEELQRAWEVNVMAIWRSCKLILPIFERAGGGSIVNIGSVMSSQTSPTCIAYTATKSGLAGMTRGLAVELAGRRVRVNTIEPGYIQTYEGVDEANPAARHLYELQMASAQPWPAPGLPEHIAAATLFLLSPAAGFITGATLQVDGGLTCSLRDLLDPDRARAVAALMPVPKT